MAIPHEVSFEITPTAEDGLLPSQRFMRLAKTLFAVPKAELDARLAEPKMKRDGTPKMKPGPVKGTPKPMPKSDR
jgi:hypothetical protein